jgi:uncharacterized protein YerC
MIREANHPARRAFRECDDAYAFLAEVCTPAERQRLRTLLAARGLRAAV